jgi:hypothetical protein
MPVTGICAMTVAACVPVRPLAHARIVTADAVIPRVPAAAVVVALLPSLLATAASDIVAVATVSMRHAIPMRIVV